MILDTNFIIAAEREARRNILGAADAFLAGYRSEQFHITFTVAGELACGQSLAEHRDWRQLCQPYPVIPWSMEISWKYGEIYRLLKSKGTLIGTNDLWIAATALIHGEAVVTNNVSEFQRVPKLDVIPF